MTYRTDSPYAHDEEEYEDEEPKRGLLSRIVIVAMLVGTGSASALVWHIMGGVPILPSLVTKPAVAIAEKPAVPAPAQGDLAALRQEITGSVQSTQQLLVAQQADIKRLSEQVSALSNKLELMQRNVNSAQAAIPVPAPHAVVPSAPKKKPEAAKPVAAKPAEAKPVAPKPAADNKPAAPGGGPISTGGAPLQFSR